MPRSGAYTLSEITEPTVNIVCKECGRDGRLNTARLLAKYGDIALPHLLTLVAKDAGCPKALDPNGLEYCKAVYGPESIKA